MKALICTTVVALLLVGGVQTLPNNPPDGYFENLVDQIAECAAVKDQCLNKAPTCMQEVKIEITPANFPQKQANAQACSDENVLGADFSKLSIDDVTNGHFDVSMTGMQLGKRGVLMKCVMEKEGKLVSLTACLTGTP